MAVSEHATRSPTAMPTTVVQDDKLPLRRVRRRSLDLVQRGADRAPTQQPEETDLSGAQQAVPGISWS